jgi:hypothetical protein
LTQRDYEGEEPEQRSSHNAVEYDGELYVLGGSGESGDLNDG